MTALAAVAGGAMLLVWPALVNGYPLVFSDTGGFLHQTLGPLMLWDKPWVYGPLLHLAHWRVSLWPPVAAQALIVSHLIWLTQRAARGKATPGRHLLACLSLAVLSTAPFTVAMLLPDVFASVVVLGLFLLGPGREALSAGEVAWVALLATLGIASHLSHLPIALALVAMAFLSGLPRRRGLRDAAWTAAPPIAAVMMVLAGNVVGHGRLALSPHGATFLLARLQADGPATAVIRARCPEAGWYLCAFVDRLPMDANDFLWQPDSPVNRDAEGHPRFLGGALLSAEAGVIVGETLRAHPLAVAEAMLRNTLRQLVTFGIGDTLGPENLATALRPRLAEGFPPRDVATFDASLQAQDRLRAIVAPLVPLHAAALLLALPLLGWIAWRAWRARDAAVLALLGFVLVGIVANAAATGGLSGVFPRYQARIAWLLPLVVCLAIPVTRRPA
ncbi:hypothetical protein KPL78_27850 [Roseomonas sp. HJA6]|uniref:Glycosyltransferase RgtA/B/C/D-like domain-containing protein n=1 Tax=Roseomonas alba TaxID=2846776 RepID=A0ABS7AHA4_9PROT|nr:hypothetical protein [Neoroseomonas alba]MBW6401698.1 hypothetical protein [Neoroseomonas alba]